MRSDQELAVMRIANAVLDGERACPDEEACRKYQKRCREGDYADGVALWARVLWRHYVRARYFRSNSGVHINAVTLPEGEPKAGEQERKRADMARESEGGRVV